MTSIRLLFVGVLALAAPLALAFTAMGTAEAKHVVCDENNVCKTYCTQNLGNGAWVDYEEGAEITVNTPNGSFKYVCRNGQWIQVTLEIPNPEKWQLARRIGQIGVGSMAGLQGDLTYEKCNDSPEPVCTIETTTIMPPGQVQISP